MKAKDRDTPYTRKCIGSRNSDAYALARTYACVRNLLYELLRISRERNVRRRRDGYIIFILVVWSRKMRTTCMMSFVATVLQKFAS